MASQIAEHTARLAPQPSEAIERGRTIQFTFNGKEYQAHPGDTIASALYAAGVRTFSRSFKYHRPRGLFCAAGHCPNCLVQIGDEPNVRSCLRPVEAGMVVKPQNAWPSLDADVMSLNQLVSRFLPVGFYYKLFLWPKPMWPFYENFLRHAAGLGEVDPNAPRHYFDKAFRHTDVLVVGGGRAGLTAAPRAC
jgi:sarcosine oxidase subunit alpha